jgi:hypothetical protein
VLVGDFDGKTATNIELEFHIYDQLLVLGFGRKGRGASIIVRFINVVLRRSCSGGWESLFGGFTLQLYSHTTTSGSKNRHNSIPNVSPWRLENARSSGNSICPKS